MRLEGVKKGLVPSSTPERIAVEITISISITIAGAATSRHPIPVAIVVAVPAVSPEYAIPKTCAAVRSAPV